MGLFGNCLVCPLNCSPARPSEPGCTQKNRMSLEIRKSSRWWYGVFVVDGRKSIINLGVPITGKRPPKRTMLGDDEFERSRGRAQEAYRVLERKRREDRTGEKSLKKLAEMKTGQPVKFPKLADLPALWEAIPRRKAPDPVYARGCKQRLAAFADFADRYQRGVRDFVEVKPDTAKAFMASEEKRGVAPKTWNDMLKLLRATFKHLHPHLNDGSNPFHGIVTKATETVNREPFTVEELKAITEACAEDDFIRPVIVTGNVHGDAPRRLLPAQVGRTWITRRDSSRSRPRRRARRSTSPCSRCCGTNSPRRRAKAGKSKFCFPEAAEMYQNNPDGITWRVKQVLARALGSKVVDEGRLLPAVSPDEARSRGLGYIDSLGDTPKAARMREVFKAYMDGSGINEVMAATGASRGSVSGHLNEIEAAIGCAVIRGESGRTKDRSATGGAGERTAEGLGPGLPQFPRDVDHAGARCRDPTRIGSARHRPPDGGGRDEALLPPGAGGFPAGDPPGYAEDAGRRRAAVSEGSGPGDSRGHDRQDLASR